VLAHRAAAKGQVGLVVNLEPKYPATEFEADDLATQRADAYMNRQYLDPALLGSYPPEMHDIYGSAWPDFPASDFALIRQPIDFLGVNYYTRSVTAHDADRWPVRARAVRQAEATYTETGWEVYPDGLADTLEWVTKRYGRIPLYVTENGAAFFDPPAAIDGVVDDPNRVHYFREHLRAVHRAMTNGADMRGYYAWSLLDNLEWSLGFAKRFGIVHVNFATQQRTIKRSGRYYADVIASNGASLG
jgi:beta-glucosidase